LVNKESKFDGDTGILQRKHLLVKSIVHIGKESNNLEDTQTFGVSEKDYQVYLHSQNFIDKNEDMRKFILSLSPKTASKFGISRRRLYRMKEKKVSGFNRID